MIVINKIILILSSDGMYFRRKLAVERTSKKLGIKQYYVITKNFKKGKGFIPATEL